MNEKLVGFIYKHDDGTYTMWSAEISPEDTDVINNILMKYQNDGVSVRGNAQDISFEDINFMKALGKAE